MSCENNHWCNCNGSCMKGQPPADLEVREWRKMLILLKWQNIRKAMQLSRRPHWSKTVMQNWNQQNVFARLLQKDTADVPSE
jgi:hypothetical protein